MYTYAWRFCCLRTMNPHIFGVVVEQPKQNETGPKEFVPFWLSFVSSNSDQYQIKKTSYRCKISTFEFWRSISRNLLTWRNFDVKQQAGMQRGSWHKEWKNLPLFVWRDSFRFSSVRPPDKPASPCACALLLCKCAGCLDDVCFWREKYAGIAWIWYLRFAPF